MWRFVAMSFLWVTAAYGEPVSGVSDGIPYAVSSNGLAVFSTEETDWLVHCGGSACIAYAQGAAIYLQARDWGVIANKGRHVAAVQRKRELYPIPVQKALSTSEHMRLLSGDRLIFQTDKTENLSDATAVSLDGINVVMRYMSTMVGVNSSFGQDPTPKALVQLEMADAQRQSGFAQLVPFTKPQVEFAIRAQTGN